MRSFNILHYIAVDLWPLSFDHFSIKNKSFSSFAHDRLSNIILNADVNLLGKVSDIYWLLMCLPGIIHLWYVGPVCSNNGVVNI